MRRASLASCRSVLAAACLSVLAAACPSILAAAGGIGSPPASAATAATAPSAAAAVRVRGPAGAPPSSAAQGFLGIATELTTIPALAGSPADPDTPFVRMLRALSPGAPFLLRLGGVSADDAWWPVPGMSVPPYLHALTPQWGADVHALLTALGGQAIVGVNFKEPTRIDAQIAPAEVADFNRYVGASLIDAFELGNEPEFYPPYLLGEAAGEHDPFTAYGRKFSQIAATFGGTPIAGPASGSAHWLGDLGAVLRSVPARLKLVTVHAYPLKHCSRSAHLLESDLFARASIAGLAASIHRAVTAARRRGKPLRVDEINGVPCGGVAGLSNSFGEALWALNVLPALWGAGVQGVNFQTVDGNLNQMITARHTAAGWRVTTEPEYLGLLAFADVAPAGSRLLRVGGPDLPHLLRFAVRAPDGSTRIVLTNVGPGARTVTVSVAGSRVSGTVTLLSARSLSATNGTTLGGQSLSSRTGELAGTPRATLVSPNARGVYAVRVPAHAAAILTLSS